jgi:hypothetical protein
MMMTPKRPAPSGNKVMHSKPTSMFGNMGNASMPKQAGPARINVPTDHSCKVCPGSARKTAKY